MITTWFDQNRIYMLICIMNKVLYKRITKVLSADQITEILNLLELHNNKRTIESATMLPQSILITLGMTNMPDITEYDITQEIIKNIIRSVISTVDYNIIQKLLKDAERNNFYTLKSKDLRDEEVQVIINMAFKEFSKNKDNTINQFIITTYSMKLLIEKNNIGNVDLINSVPIYAYDFNSNNTEILYGFTDLKGTSHVKHLSISGLLEE